MVNFIHLIKSFHKVNLLKTLYFNFKYLPKSQSIKLPIFIYYNTSFYKLNGTIILESKNIQMGMIKIGAHNAGTIDVKFERTILELSGKLLFNGKCNIGKGSRISIGNNGILCMGNNTSITGNTSIICKKKISIGNNCIISWDNLIMDTDFHKIYDNNNNLLNDDKPIYIGNNVWIGCRCTILKNAYIGNNNIVSANSKVTKKILNENCIIANFNEIVKTDIHWRN